MFNTSGQILQQFLAGEDSHAEFKEIRFVGRGVISPSVEEIAGDLVAFANAEGGVVFLGVDDSGTVLGIPPEKLGEVEGNGFSILPPTIAIHQSVLTSARYCCQGRMGVRRPACSSGRGTTWIVCTSNFREGVTTHESGPQNGILRHRNLPGFSISGVASMCLTSSQYSLQPWTILTVIGWKRFLGVHRLFPGLTCCAIRA